MVYVQNCSICSVKTWVLNRHVMQASPEPSCLRWKCMTAGLFSKGLFTLIDCEWDVANSNGKFRFYNLRMWTDPKSQSAGIAPETPKILWLKTKRKHYTSGISVECQLLACRQYELHSEQVWTCPGVGHNDALYDRQGSVQKPPWMTGRQGWLKTLSSRNFIGGC